MGKMKEEFLQRILLECCNKDGLSNKEFKVAEFIINELDNINYRDDYLDTPLARATAHRKNKLVTLLLKRNADLDTQNSDGATPLHYAALYGYIELVKLFLEHNANIEIKDKERKTALDYAERHPKVKELLTDHKAKINVRNKNR